MSQPHICRNRRPTTPPCGETLSSIAIHVYNLSFLELLTHKKVYLVYLIFVYIDVEEYIYEGLLRIIYP